MGMVGGEGTGGFGGMKKPAVVAGYILDDTDCYSSLSICRSCSRSSGVSSWPWTSAACRAATGSTSSSFPEIFSVQFVSLGNSLQSMNLRPAPGDVAVAILFTSFAGISAPNNITSAKSRKRFLAGGDPGRWVSV